MVYTNLPRQDIRTNVRGKSTIENTESDKEEKLGVSFSCKIFDGTEVDLDNPWAKFLILGDEDNDSDSGDDQAKLVKHI